MSKDKPMTKFKKMTQWISEVRMWGLAALTFIALGVAVSSAGWRPVLKFEFDARFVGLDKKLDSARCSNIKVLIAINRNARTNSYRERRQTKAAASRIPTALARPGPSPALAREIEELEQERVDLLFKKLKYCGDSET